MEPRKTSRWASGVLLAIGLLAPASPTAARAGSRHFEPAEVVPMAQLAPQHREAVADLIRDPTVHRQGKPETFPCNPKVYLSLVNEPVLTLALWRDLSPTPAQLQQVSANRFVGSDGSGTSATWEYLLRSPRLHVMLCQLDYTTPRGNARLTGRILLVVRSNFFREVNGEFWVQHHVEAFVKVDSRGWKAVAATVRPLIERILEDQVQEAGLFVSLMGRLVEMYPDWAREVAARNPGVRADARDAFRELVQQTRRPGAYTGRPVVADASDPKATPETQRR